MAPDAASSKHSAGTRRSSTSGEEQPAGTKDWGVKNSGVQRPSSICPVAAASDTIAPSPPAAGSFSAAAKSVRARRLPTGHSMAAAPEEPRSGWWVGREEEGRAGWCRRAVLSLSLLPPHHPPNPLTKDALRLGEHGELVVQHGGQQLRDGGLKLGFDARLAGADHRGEKVELVERFGHPARGHGGGPTDGGDATRGGGAGGGRLGWVQEGRRVCEPEGSEKKRARLAPLLPLSLPSPKTTQVRLVAALLQQGASGACGVCVCGVLGGAAALAFPRAHRSTRSRPPPSPPLRRPTAPLPPPPATRHHPRPVARAWGGGRGDRQAWGGPQLRTCLASRRPLPPLSHSPVDAAAADTASRATAVASRARRDMVWRVVWCGVWGGGGGVAKRVLRSRK